MAGEGKMEEEEEEESGGIDGPRGTNILRFCCVFVVVLVLISSLALTLATLPVGLELGSAISNVFNVKF